MSGWSDSNARSHAPKACALDQLGYIPEYHPFSFVTFFFYTLKNLTIQIAWRVTAKSHKFVFFFGKHFFFGGDGIRTHKPF